MKTNIFKWKIHLFKLALTIPFNSFIVTLFVYAIFLTIQVTWFLWNRTSVPVKRLFAWEQLAILSFLSNTLPYSRGWGNVYSLLPSRWVNSFAYWFTFSKAVSRRFTIKKMFWKILQKLPENICAWVPFLMKLQAFFLQIY